MSSSMGQTSDTSNTSNTSGAPNMSSTSSTPSTSSTSSAMGQGATGMPNYLYDLVSVLYHSLKSGTTNQKYLQDAQQSGNNDLVQFFQQLQQEDSQRAQRAQQLLGQQISSSQQQPTH
jgi:hypothetical protein